MFVDDIACRSNTKQGHLQDIRALFDRLAKYRCALGIGKCKFFQKKVLFLGHVVSKEGIESDPRKVKAIDAFTLKRMQRPKDVQVFLQTVAYMRKFIRNFSQVSAPLSKYLKKTGKVLFRKELKGDIEAQEAFHELKHRLKTAPILAPPDYSRPWEVHTDGSGRGVAGALIQRGEDGLRRVVMYASRALRQPELVYSVYEIEFLAGAFSFSVFRVYIAGSKVDWYVDHAALKACDRRSTGRTQRWLADLLTIDFRVIFVPGKKNTLPDGLSRFPIPGPSIYGNKPIPLLSVTAHKDAVGGRPDHLTLQEAEALKKYITGGI